MIQVSTEVANALSQLSREFDAKIYVNGSAVDCEIMSLKLHKGACGKFTVGSIFIPYVELTVNGTTTLTTNTEFELKIAVKVNGSFGTYYRVGYFTPTSIGDGQTQTEIYAQGRIANTNEVLFSTEPSSRSLSSIFSALQSWCTSKGFSAQLKGLTLPSATIDQLLPLKDFTVRDTISLLVSCAGGYATEDYNGNFQLCKFQSTTPQTIKADQLAEYPVIKGTYTLTGITVVVNESLKYDIGSNPQFEIQNPYFNSNMVSQFTSNTIGYSFPVTEMPIALGDFRFEPWDYIAIESGLTPSNSLVPSDNLVPQDGLYSEAFPCLTLDFDFDGGLQTTVKAEGELPEEQAQKTAGPISAQLKEAYDKAVVANNLASQARAEASQALDTAEAVYEGEGVSVSEYRRTLFARSSSNTTAPTTGWSESLPTLTSTYKYLWVKTQTIQVSTYTDEEGHSTSMESVVGEGTPAPTTLMEGVYTFISGAATGATVINGGCITANSIDLDTVRSSDATIGGFSINSNYLSSGPESLTDTTHQGTYMGSSTSGGGLMNVYGTGSNQEIAKITMGRLYLSGYGGTHTSYLGSSILSLENDYSISLSAITGIGVIPKISTTKISCTGGDIEGKNQRNLINNITTNECHVGNSSDSLYLYGLTSTTSTSYSDLRTSGNRVYYSSHSGSSRRIKHDIEDLEFYNPSLLYDLPVRQFYYNDDYFSDDDCRKGKNIHQVGLIAEEVEAIFNQAVVYDEEGLPTNWSERELIPLMLKLIQDQHKEIELLKERLDNAI